MALVLALLLVQLSLELELGQQEHELVELGRTISRIVRESSNHHLPLPLLVLLLENPSLAFSPQ